MKKIVLATSNFSKKEQIRPFLADLSVPFLTMQEAGVKGEAPELGTTLFANAIDKATYAHDQLNDPDCIVIAEDTGIFIEALEGRPGVHSKRWAGENTTTEDIMRYTLRKMEGVENRNAVFICAAVILMRERKALFNGRVEGKILTAPVVRPQPSMPYSPIFQPDGSDKVWAQMSIEEENAISHRGQAFRKVRAYLQAFLKQ